MKRIKKLIADAVFYTGHYGNKASIAMLEFSMKLHVDFDTDTGRKITAVKQELERRAMSQLQAKPQAGVQYVRGQSIFIKTDKPGKS